MNRLPKFGGGDGQWVYDRILVVNCPNVVPVAKQDKQLLDKMYAERNGIAYKAVKALQTVIANGYRFSEPQSVADARKEYRFEECMCPWPQGRINRHCTTGRIFKVYQAWCRDNNHGYAKSAKDFREELAAHLGTHVTVSRHKALDIWKVQCGFSTAFFGTKAEALAYCKGRFCDGDGQAV